jgi:hypothetical protein
VCIDKVTRITPALYHDAVIIRPQAGIRCSHGQAAENNLGRGSIRQDKANDICLLTTVSEEMRLTRFLGRSLDGAADRWQRQRRNND